jgi:hypothetical protein
MTAPTIEYRVEVETASGGKMVYTTEKREKAETYFNNANEAETNVYGLFGTIAEDGEWDGVIDEFDRRDEEA